METFQKETLPLAQQCAEVDHLHMENGALRKYVSALQREVFQMS